MRGGMFAKLTADDHGGGGGDDDARLRFVGQYEGFNFHAGVRIAAGDDLGRERSCRYAARPPLALARLRRLRDGRYAYQVKYSRRGTAKHRVMTALELMARLSALIPPPRHPLVRFHGVLAPHSSWRRLVVPDPRFSPRLRPDCGSKRPTSASSATSSPAQEVTTNRPLGRPPGEKPVREDGGGDGAPQRSSASALVAPQPPDLAMGTAVQVAPNVISLSHWQRLRDGALLATSTYVD
jgi:hypothetical protein